MRLFIQQKMQFLFIELLPKFHSNFGQIFSVAQLFRLAESAVALSVPLGLYALVERALVNRVRCDLAEIGFAQVPDLYFYVLFIFSVFFVLSLLYKKSQMNGFCKKDLRCDGVFFNQRVFCEMNH